MSLFKKHLAAQLKLQKRAEDESKEEEMEKEAADESSENEEEKVEAAIDENEDEGQEKEANEMLGYDDVMTAEEEEFGKDQALNELGDAVEALVEEIVGDVQSAMLQHNTRAQVNNAILHQLNYRGILVENPYKQAKLKPTKFSKSEIAFINRTVNAAVEAVEEVLRASAKKMIERKYSAKKAAYLDRRYQKNGYLRSTVAKPKLRPGTQKVAKQAESKTRKASNVLGLE